MKQFVFALTLGLATLAAAQAQPVYRCGNEYTREPCPNGRLVEATDRRSSAQRAEAGRVAADERRLADDMRRERLAEQAAIKPALATSLSGSAPASAEPAAKREGRSSNKKKRTVTKLLAANAGVTGPPAKAKKRRAPP